MNPTLTRLHGDATAAEIIRRAHERDRKHGSGDMQDFALFVVDEARRASDTSLRAAINDRERAELEALASLDEETALVMDLANALTAEHLAAKASGIPGVCVSGCRVCALLDRAR